MKITVGKVLKAYFNARNERRDIVVEQEKAKAGGETLKVEHGKALIASASLLYILETTTAEVEVSDSIFQFVAPYLELDQEVSPPPPAVVD